MRTAMPRVQPPPVTWTVPPVRSTAVGEMDVTEMGATYEYAAGISADEPSPLATSTDTGPGPAAAGAVTVRSDGVTAKVAAARPPNESALVASNDAPEICTTVPP